MSWSFDTPCDALVRVAGPATPLTIGPTLL
jgi:hypothetical protein